MERTSSFHSGVEVFQGASCMSKLEELLMAKTFLDFEASSFNASSSEGEFGR